MSENEYFVDYEGAGFRSDHPGIYANCRVWFDSTTHEVLRIEPLEGVASTPAEPVSAQPEKSAQSVEQTAEQPNQAQGG